MPKSVINKFIQECFETVSLPSECNNKNNRAVSSQVILTVFFFLVACFACTPDRIELVNWGTWHRC